MNKYSQQDVEMFVGLLKEVLGVDPSELVSGIDYINTQRREQSIAPLKDKWGENFDYYYSETEKFFNTLPPESQAKFADAEGAEYLFNTRVKDRLPAQQLPPQGQQQTQQPPGFDRGAVRQTALPSGMAPPDALSIEQINEMSNADRAKNWDAIKQTFATQAQRE